MTVPLGNFNLCTPGYFILILTCEKPPLSVSLEPTVKKNLHWTLKKPFCFPRFFLHKNRDCVLQYKAGLVVFACLGSVSQRSRETIGPWWWTAEKRRNIRRSFRGTDCMNTKRKNYWNYYVKFGGCEIRYFSPILFCPIPKQNSAGKSSNTKKEEKKDKETGGRRKTKYQLCFPLHFLPSLFFLFPFLIFKVSAAGRRRRRSVAAAAAALFAAAAAYFPPAIIKRRARSLPSLLYSATKKTRQECSPPCRRCTAEMLNVKQFDPKLWLF